VSNEDGTEEDVEEGDKKGVKEVSFRASHDHPV
jgi:hypothetical protein